MKSAIPYLNFDGNAEEAFNHYKSVFGGEFFGIVRFAHFGASPGMPELSDDEKRLVAHISLPLGDDGMLMGSDILQSLGQSLTVGDNVTVHLVAESRDEAESLFAGLSDGGTVTMPLDSTEWAELYGCCIDRFGVTWGVNFAGSVEFALPQE